MGIILLFYHNAARRYSDETCFIFEIYSLLDHSKNDGTVY